MLIYSIKQDEIFFSIKPRNGEMTAVVFGPDVVSVNGNMKHIPRSVSASLGYQIQGNDRALLLEMIYATFLRRFCNLGNVVEF
jgi:hypothetical protein